jgi:hypothetical protein
MYYIESERLAEQMYSIKLSINNKQCFFPEVVQIYQLSVYGEKVADDNTTLRTSWSGAITATSNLRILGSDLIYCNNN